MIYALDPDNGYMIAQWADEDRILVASTDPDEDPKVIPAHFADFLEGNKSHLAKPVFGIQ